MTETIQIILTFVSLATAFTFFVMWLTEKERNKKLKEETETLHRNFTILEINYDSAYEKHAELSGINYELGNKIDLLENQLKDLKRKNRIKGKK